MFVRMSHKDIKVFIALCFLLMMFVKIFISREDNVSVGMLADLSGMMFLPTLYFIFYGIQVREKIITIIFIMFIMWLGFCYFYYSSIRQKENFDTLKLEYPALSSQNDQAISNGWTREQIRRYLGQRTKLALTQYTPQEVNQFLGRDENSIRKLIEEMQLQNDDSYVEIMKYNMSENRVKYILNISKYSGIAPSMLLISNDLLIYAEKIANEHKTVFDEFRDVIDIKSICVVLDLIVICYFLIFELIKIVRKLCFVYGLKLKIYWYKKSKLFRVMCLIDVIWILTILGLSLWLGAELWSDKFYFDKRAIINFLWTLFFPLFIIDLVFYCYKHFIK